MKSYKMTAKKSVCLLVAVSTAFATSCDALSSSSSELEPEYVAHAVWSEYSTQFVLRDEDVNVEEKAAATYQVSAARGEHESSQIIITAGTDAIEEYTIEVSDLVSTTNAENKITADNIYVYKECYIHVKSSTSTNANGILGWYPDAMLPFDIAVDYGENNVAAGDNQGLYISTYIPFATAAGEYTGTFKLTIDGEETLIPASVTVWDFEVPQQRSMVTQVGWGFSQQSTLFANMDTTDEMKELWRDWLVSYGLCPSNAALAHQTEDDWVDWVRITTNPNLVDENGQPYHTEEVPYLGSVTLHTKYNANTGIDYAYFDGKISKLIVASIRDSFNYIERLHVYPSYIDEPQYSNAWEKTNHTFNGWNTRKAYWADLLARALSADTTAAEAAIQEINAASGKDVTKAEMSEKTTLVEELKGSMQDVPMYLTCFPDSRLDPEIINQFCGRIDSMDTEAERYDIEQWVQGHRIQDIWYSVSISYGVGFIDSSRMENRLIGWYTRYTNRRGYLVWAADLMTYRYGNASDSLLPNDPWEDAVHISSSNGDGYFCYPGAKYGLSTPVAGLRLLQLRDSVEEYEYFVELGKLYKAAGYSEDAILNKIFSTLFNEATVGENSKTFVEQRNLVAKLIVLAKKGVFVTDYNEINGIASMSVKATGEERIAFVNGQACDLTEATATFDTTKAVGSVSFATTSGISFDVNIAGQATSLLAMDTSVVKVINGATKKGSGATAQYTDKEGQAELTTIPGTDVQALKFTYNVDRVNILQDYAPYNFFISTASSAVSRKSNYLAVTFYNPSNEDILVQCYLKGSGGVTLLKDKVLKSGWNIMYISQFDQAKWSLVKTLQGIRFNFKSYNKEDVHDFTVYCTGVYEVR